MLVSECIVLVFAWHIFTRQRGAGAFLSNLISGPGAFQGEQSLSYSLPLPALCRN